MKKEQTPKWLINGALASWSSKAKFYKNPCFVMIVFEFMFGALGIKLFDPIGPNTSWYSFFGFLLGIIILTLVFHYLHIKILMRTIGYSKKWQKLYLQSNIAEFEEYSSSFEDKLAEVAGESARKFEELNNNYFSLLKKKTEAEELLLQI